MWYLSISIIGFFDWLKLLRVYILLQTRGDIGKLYGMMAEMVLLRSSEERDIHVRFMFIPPLFINTV